MKKKTKQKAYVFYERNTCPSVFFDKNMCNLIKNIDFVNNHGLFTGSRFEFLQHHIHSPDFFRCAVFFQSGNDRFHFLAGK